MRNIEQIIKENQEEFMGMVISFVNKKEGIQKKKAPKTICHFTAFGKKYNSDVFTNNYSQLLNDVSNIHGYDIFKKVLGKFVEKDIKDFCTSKKKNASFIYLNNGAIVSCYSSTEKKKLHIQGICNNLNVPVEFLV